MSIIITDSTLANLTAIGNFSTPTGQAEYTVPGSYTWTAPAGVTSVSVVAVGPGGDSFAGPAAGGGGGLGYKNNIPVTPGYGYSVVVGANSIIGGHAYDSYFCRPCLVSGGSHIYECYGCYWGDGGGPGGSGGYGAWPGGGGAGGYCGSGGSGANGSSNSDYIGNTGGNGAGGGGGGWYPGGGGGVGLYGRGPSGTGGAGRYSCTTNADGIVNGGSGGSFGRPGMSYTTNAAAPGQKFIYSFHSSGGRYGGGGGNPSEVNQGYGAPGAVRIIWPGTTRSFPSTNTGDM